MSLSRVTIDADNYDQLCDAFGFLERLEQVIDARRESHGSFGAALASMGADLDQVLMHYLDLGITPENTIELLLSTFSESFSETEVMP